MSIRAESCRIVLNRVDPGALAVARPGLASILWSEHPLCTTIMAVPTNQQTSATAGGEATTAPTDPSVAFEAAVMADLADLGETTTQQTERRGAKATKPEYDPDDPDQPEPEEEAGPEDEEETPEVEAEAEADEETETEDEDTEEESDEPEDDTEEEDDTDPASYAKLPAWAKKRLSSQGRQLRELREAAAKLVTVAPSPSSPLADVETEADLQARQTVARQIRDWVRQNPYGGVIKGDNGDFQVTEEMAQEKLRHAEAILDAVPDAQRRLHVRASTKPWEQAAAICPNLFKQGSEEHAFAMTALQKCPAIKTSLDNWEMFIAAAVRGLTQAAEESAGKAKYVRVPVKNGKAVGPSVAQSAKPGTKPATATPAKPVAVKGAPPLGKSGGKPNLEALAAKARESRDPEDFAALVRAELAA
jgi:hypothetical protein